MKKHHWTECAPALFRISAQNGHRDERAALAAQRVWARASDADRQSFHRFCCLNSREPADIDVIRRLAQAIENESA